MINKYKLNNIIAREFIPMQINIHHKNKQTSRGALLQLAADLQNQKLVHLDPKEADTFFNKKKAQLKKLQKLQEPVFKNFIIKKSKSVYHFKQIHQQQPQQILQPNFPKDINIETISSSNSIKLLSFGTSKSEKTNARTLSLFTPRVMANVNKYGLMNKQQRMIEKLKNLKKNNFKNQQLQKSKYSQLKDSQSILRKNSLFLMNCLKTRYKRNNPNSHIGHMAETASHIQLNDFKTKLSNNTHYHQRFQYMQEAKQKLLELKVVKHEVFKRSSSTLKPEPWF